MAGDANYLSRLSTNLSKVLDTAGASDYVRRTRQHCTRVKDVLGSLAMGLEGSDVSIYTFGSTSEGTTTTGLSSDSDTLMCFNQFPVYELEEDIDLEKEINAEKYEVGGELDEIPYIRMVHDQITPNGYIKIEMVNADDDLRDDDEVMAVDANGRKVMINGAMVGAMTQDERNGPAATTLSRPGFSDLDYIPAYRCRRWPRQAEEWLTRDRKYGFPSEDVNRDFGNLGIFIVPVGHADSAEKHLQWRYAFSLQERKMMMNLNETQYKCYILLKLMKEDFVKPVVPGKSLTSYHCKTSMFHLLEVTDKTTWIPGNLLAYFSKCIQTLKIWVQNAFVPSYFMPNNNIWKGDLDMQTGVVSVLDSVLQNIPESVMNIRRDKVGKYLKNAIDPCLHEIESEKEDKGALEDELKGSRRQLHLEVHRLHYKCIGDILGHARSYIQHTYEDNEVDKCIRRHKSLIRLLQDTQKLCRLTEQAEEAVKEAVDYILPFIYTSLGSQIAAKVIGKPDGVLEQTAMDYLITGQNSDSLAGAVKHAAVLYAQGLYTRCLHLLISLDEGLENHVISHGMCGKMSPDYTHKHLVNEARVNRILERKMSTKEILLECTATCVVFLPTELPLIPKHLQYEMFRSVFAETEVNPNVHDWYGIAAVDSKILLYYLLYRVHEKLGHDRESRVALVFLLATSEDDYNLSHYDTTCNLTGCILREQGRWESALGLFWDSWRRRPDHNAAKWHAAITCFEYFQCMRTDENTNDSKPHSATCTTDYGDFLTERVLYTRE